MCNLQWQHLPKSCMCILHISLLIIIIVCIAANVLHCTKVIRQVYKLVCHTFLHPVSICKILDLGALSTSSVWGIAMDIFHLHGGAKTLEHSIRLYVIKLLFPMEKKPKHTIWEKEDLH